jgi:hypothetical protein
MNPHHFQEFMQDYAKHFDLLKDINFNTSVKRVTRNMADTTWIVEIEREGKTEMLEFDKVAFCHGYQTKADLPAFEGQEKFAGDFIHAQQYRKYVQNSLAPPPLALLTHFIDLKTLPARKLSSSALGAQQATSSRIWFRMHRRSSYHIAVARYPSSASAMAPLRTLPSRGAADR